MKPSKMLLLLAALSLAGCQSLPKVESETAAGANLGAYRTFAVLMQKGAAPAADPGLAMRLSGPARQAVIDDLTARGLSEAPLRQADFTVNLRGQSLPKIEIDNYGYSHVGFTRYGRAVPLAYGTTQVTTYDERTLIVEFYDNRTREMVWVGWLTTRRSGKVEVGKVVEAIHHILKSAPVGTMPAPAS